MSEKEKEDPGERRVLLVHVSVVPGHESGGVETDLREVLPRLRDAFSSGSGPGIKRLPCIAWDRMIDPSTDQMGIGAEPRIQVTRLPIEDGAYEWMRQRVSDRSGPRGEPIHTASKGNGDVLEFIA